MSEPAERRQISGWAVLVVVGAVLVLALALNWYNHREQDRNVDRFVEQVDD